MHGGRAALLALVPGLLALGLLAGCATPPPSAYARLGTVSKPPDQVLVGRNAVGETCTESPSDGGGIDIYCGSWQQPSARVRPGGAAAAGSLQGLATASPWRVGIDSRFQCQPAARTSILGGNPAELLQCTQRVGGWPHVAMVALIDGRAWYGDAVLPAAQVMEQGIGIAAGIARPGVAPAGSQADALLAQRLAAQAFSSSDIGAYQQLMTAGTRANLADDPASAEAAFRAALAVQERALGKDNPNLATTLATLGLQLSNQGRFLAADDLFGRAQQLAPAAAQPTTPALVDHYRAIDAFNQGRLDAALRLLRQAEAGYAALVPASLLAQRPSGTLIPDQDLFVDPTARFAVEGLVEARRNEGLVLRQLGRLEESRAVLASASELARRIGAPQVVLARVDRSRGITDAAAGNAAAALSALAASTAAFARALPDSKPLADVYLLRAGELVGAGRPAAALPICRNAITALNGLKAGTSPDLIGPCLQSFAYAAEAAAPAGKQALDAEMFAAAQLAQDSITSRQIAQAAARLQESARNPKVAEAIRHRQDAASTLESLYRQRDSLPPGGQPALAADLDKRIAAARTGLADADTALQAASPNFGQLVQQVVPASAVMRWLRPDEAFLSVFLSARDGWTFLIRSGRIEVAPIAGGAKQVGALVHDVRASIEETTNTPPPFNVSAARALYATLVAPFAPALNGATALVVAPSGPLLALPFEVLLSGPADDAHLADAPWLATRYAIAHVPAPANFVSLRKAAQGAHAPQPWFGFGDFRPVTLAQAQASFPGASCAESAELLSRLPQLPFASRELAAARLIMGASASDELLGPNFTAPAVLKARLKEFRILHFATHALLPTDLRCESEPAIVASAPPNAPSATPALLTASDVIGMDLNADLVILSACNTGGPNGGAGGSTAGESLSGLARAFFYAGARALMVTHWSVNDRATAYLVALVLKSFHDHPQRGIAAALADAQRQILAQAKAGDGALAHPFYWASLALIGDAGGGTTSVADAEAPRTAAAR